MAHGTWHMEYIQERGKPSRVYEISMQKKQQHARKTTHFNTDPNPNTENTLYSNTEPNPNQ